MSSRFRVGMTILLFAALGAGCGGAKPGTSAEPASETPADLDASQVGSLETYCSLPARVDQAVRVIHECDPGDHTVKTAQSIENELRAWSAGPSNIFPIEILETSSFQKKYPDLSPSAFLCLRKNLCH